MNETPEPQKTGSLRACAWWNCAPPSPARSVVGFHLAGIGQSHYCSLVDVLLGSLRFATNCFTQKNEQHLKSSEAILRQLARCSSERGGTFEDPTKVHEISLWFSPKTVKVEKYRVQYLALRDYLAKYGIHAAQSV